MPCSPLSKLAWSCWQWQVLRVILLWVIMWLAAGIASPRLFVGGLFMISIRAIRTKVAESTEELFDMVSFVLTFAIWHVMLADIEDSILRNRAFGMCMITWRAVMSQFWHRRLPCTLAFIIISVSEMYVNFASFRKDTIEASTPRLVFIPSVLTVAAFMLYRCHTQAFVGMQQELEEEKDAKEQLISMLCETCVNIGQDGETLTNSNPHFNSLVGKETVGTTLKSYICGGEVEEARLADAFMRARCVPVALPVTLISKQQVAHQVHLFIVRWRMCVQADFRFLVGIQIEQSSSDGWNNVPTSPRLDRDTRRPDADKILCAGLSGFFDDEGASAASAASCARHSAPAEVTPKHAGQQNASAHVRQQSAPPKLTSARVRQQSAPPCGRQRSVATVLTSQAMQKQNSAISTQELTGKHQWPDLGKQQGDNLPCAPGSEGHPGMLECEDCEAVDRISFISGSSAPCTDWSFPTLLPPQPRHASKSTPLSSLAQIFVPSCSILPAEGTDELQPVVTPHYIDTPLSQTGLCVKRTFINSASECGSEPRRSVSAPPSLFRSEDCVYARPRQQAALAMSDLFSRSSDDNDAAHEPEASNFSSAPSEASIAIGPATLVKVGHSMPGELVSQTTGRLSSILKMKLDGKQTVGSCHNAHLQCAPCSFHFSHIRFPETRPACKASFMCEYCHDTSHFPKWRSSLRKPRKPPGGRAKDSSVASSPRQLTLADGQTDGMGWQ